MPRVVAVCVVEQLLPDAGTVGVTAIDKRPVVGPVPVGPFGVRGDVQADRKHHGGRDQAVYAYASEDASFWEGELGRPLPPGFFGENLRVEGLDVNASRVGDRWHIGDRLVLEVTTPRMPCQTFARRIGGTDERGWVRRFTRARRLGPYLRVITTGQVQAGDDIRVVSAGPDAVPLLADVPASDG